MEFSVQLLGTNSALPIHGRFPTSQYLRVNNQHLLLDCGEGTQIQLDRFKIKRNKINNIFISHLHGDHIFGLPGLLGSFNHFNRTHPIHIYGPNGIEEFIELSFRICGAKVGYEIVTTEIPAETSGNIVIDNDVVVRYFPLKHRITNFGYRIELKPHKKNLDKKAIKKYKLSIPMIKAAKAGKDVILPNGDIILNKDLTLPQKKTWSYGFCSDTVYDEELVDHIKHVDLLYHETTYLDGMEKEAKERMHSTLGQAIKIARKAEVSRLLTGHYSSRYTKLDDFRKIVKGSDLPVLIGEEGEIYSVVS